MIDLNKLHYFRSVVEVGKLREAATLLSISPGALSRAIRSLGDDLGDELFHGEGRSFQITEFGKLVYYHSCKLVEEGRSFEKLIRGKLEQDIELRLATFEVFSTHLLAQAICQEFGDGQRLHVLERVPGDLENSIQSGDADVGITYLPQPMEGVGFLKICPFSFGVYVSENMRQHVPIESLPFAVPVTYLDWQGRRHVKSLDCWPVSVPRKEVYRFEMLETAIQTTLRGTSAIHCPDFFARCHNKGSAKNRLRRLSTPFKPVSRDVYIVMSDDRIETPAIKKLARAIRQIVKG